MRPCVVSIALVLVLVAPADAHDVNLRLSRSGLEFLEAELRELVPTYLELPPMTVPLVDPCPGDTAITLTQEQTQLWLDVQELDLSLSGAGSLRVDLTADISGRGEATFDNLFLCFGSTSCEDSLESRTTRGVMILDLWLDEFGEARVSARSVDVAIAPEDFSMTFSDCGIDDLLNVALDAGRDWVVATLTKKLEDLVKTRIAPKLEAMLQSLSSYKAYIGPATVEAVLEALAVEEDGLELGLEVDGTSRYEANDCVANDPGDPPPHRGPKPDLAEGKDAHLALSVNLGFIDDVLYHTWREGFLCLSPEELGAFGLNVDLSIVGELLPGFPPGTTFSLATNATRPPRVRSKEGATAMLTLDMRGAIADLYAHFPDGTVRSLHLELDAEATASVVLDPSVNALMLEIGDVRVPRLGVDDALGLEAAGFDFARIKQLLEEVVLPKLIDDLPKLPVTGPVVGEYGYYAILRELRTTRAHLFAKADLYRAPEDDHNPPETQIEELPSRPVRPVDAAITVSGRDEEVPGELLRYVVSVDGVENAPTFVRKVSIGAAGRTATYRVEVAAIDLADNRDRTPAMAEVTVDGILPRLRILEHPTGTVVAQELPVAWEASDDLTAEKQLAFRAQVFRLDQDDAQAQGDLVDEVDLGTGTRSGSLSLVADGAYRVVVEVKDEAGNAAHDSFLVTMGGGAHTNMCGCHAGLASVGHGAGLVALLLFAAATLACRRCGRLLERWNGVLFAEPVAQVNHSAARAAKGE